MKSAILKPGKEVSIRRGHPWIFSGAIAKHDEMEAGDWLEVFDHKNQFIAAGFWGTGSIAVRILSRKSVSPDLAFWKEKIHNCLHTRNLLDFYPEANTNAYRLVHGEGDSIPGLIADVYGTCVVLQAHDYGIYRNLELIKEAILETLPWKPTTIYSKSKATLHDKTVEDVLLFGNELETVAKENGISFKVNWAEGQKTGFFLDQRFNRELVGKFSKDKSVMNCFSYSGGFSVYALKAGASEVASIDVSQKAVDLANENVILNQLDENKHHSITADVLEYLKEQKDQWDIVILDPPAFAKNLKKKHAAVMGYKRLNALGMQAVKPGGLLFTFSCSQVIDTDLFTNTITAAGIECGRNARILYRLGQGPDHPVNLFHPEGSYLKGLVLQID